MILKISSVVCILTVILWKVSSESSTEDTSHLLEAYQVNINTSLILSQSGKELINSWAVDHQVQLVQVTTKYRLQMNRHKENCFGKTNPKWDQCIDLYSDEVTRSEQLYSDGEIACIKSTNEEWKEKKNAVDQIEREVKKWRRSYKYLLHLCEINNSNDANAINECLVDYIKQDNYSDTLIRLLIMKIDALSDLYLHQESAMKNLEECLSNVLIRYVEKIRSLMESLNRCYDGKKKE